MFSIVACKQCIEDVRDKHTLSCMYTHIHTQGHFIKSWIVVNGIWNTMPQAETFCMPFLLFFIRCDILSLRHLAWLIC